MHPNVASCGIGIDVVAGELNIEGVPQRDHAGQIMQATSLLKSKPNPTDQDIDNEMAGNICRCGTYNRIRAAIKEAAKGNV